MMNQRQRAEHAQNLKIQNLEADVKRHQKMWDNQYDRIEQVDERLEERTSMLAKNLGDVHKILDEFQKAVRNRDLKLICYELASKADIEGRGEHDALTEAKRLYEWVLENESEQTGDPDGLSEEELEGLADEPLPPQEFYDALDETRGLDPESTHR
ncbi:hypothetical protein PBI_SUZY_68 [Gordonia phage Suzy]|uniref:Uncharacterized protein n=1 Tax=Gordonia phage Suzy TaxID=2201430 RepID=A0A2Z4Q7Z5_9CAUD|nr:hypothetical protein HOT44_gp68 [Gordonia phage Suzy]AWY06172.1 hypothetical protein PBI_SUZY_68 [Gordonia phage Suzy]